ncbi:MAG: CpaF family protein [Candidatus Poseidoniia archaeon]|jgi:flagellar protein FlaI|nr:CpaF family protein [Candidatus Poseidoniia archaeon]|tara:strand:- start:3507 stop:4745 length:1239 start_codon:yes stop_codon:yes gene_type:complete
MSQGKLIAKYPNAHVVEQPGQDLPVYRVLKLNRSTSYGPLRPLLEDDNLEEVMFNNPAKPVMVYHRKHGMCVTNISMTEEEAVKVIQKIAAYVGRKIGMENLLLDGRLPDGSRVNATLPPASPGGPTLTIRKQTQDPLTFVDLIGFGTLTPRLAALLWMFVDGMGAAPCNILVSGGTASGKTSTLNVLGLFIPSQVRLITIEDVSEIQLLHEHHVQLETVNPAKAGDPELDMDALLKNTLRMRPDRLIVGEVRGAEARTLFTAMNTGHDGCMGTVHANTAQESVQRLVNPPMSVPPIMLNALHLIIMQSKLNIGGQQVRRITEVSEMAGLEGDKPRLNTIFRWDQGKGKLVETGVPSKLRERIASAAGVSPAKFDEMARNRQKIIETLVERGISDITQVSRVVQNYYQKLDR